MADNTTNTSTQQSATPQIPPISSVEFPPLSSPPLINGTMVRNNPVDALVPQLYTPVPAGMDPKTTVVNSDLSQVMLHTEQMIQNGLKQMRHVNAITMELKILLEYEEKILDQVITRIDKFKALRDENKKKASDWEAEYQKKLPEYDSYSTKLVNVPQTQPITVEGVPDPVQQKILFQIVSRTSNTADRVVVSLSMEQTVANDIDLTLGSLKKICTLMLKRVRTWLKLLKKAIVEQDTVVQRWGKFRDVMQKMHAQSNSPAPTTSGQTAVSAHQLKSYEDRIKKLEDAVCQLGGPTCSAPESQAPSPTSAAPPGAQASDEERLRRIEQAICRMCPDYLPQACSQNRPAYPQSTRAYPGRRD